LKRNINLFEILFSSCLLLSFYSSENSLSAQRDLYKYLPDEDKIEGWKKDGSLQQYKGEDLYLYIDGGAEIYHEYGFRKVIIQDYINKNEKSISLEIFEMTTPESAYGIYTFKTSPEGKELDLGNGAQLADYYLNFWKGNIIVTLTGFDEDEETIEGLLEIARAVEVKIEIRGTRPSIVSMLPKKDLVPQSIKYFKGNLGLYNSYSFFTKDVFWLKGGVKGDYKDGYSLFIISYDDIDESKKRFSKAKKNFRESPRYKNYEPFVEKAFQVKNDRGQFIFISSFDRYILIVVGIVTQAQVKKIFLNFQEYINNKT